MSASPCHALIDASYERLAESERTEPGHALAWERARVDRRTAAQARAA